MRGNRSGGTTHIPPIQERGNDDELEHATTSLVVDLVVVYEEYPHYHCIVFQAESKLISISENP